MSRRPVFILLIVLALLGIACGLTAPAAPTSIPPTPAPADTATAIPPSPTPVQPTATPTEIPPTPTSTQPAPTETSTPAPLAPTPSSPAEVYKAIAAAWTNLAQAGPYHVTKVDYNGDTPFEQTELDVVPPNYHQVVSLNGKVMADQYVYDGTFYNQIMGGAWIKLPGVGSSSMSPLEGYAEGISDQSPKADGKVAGTEDVNGKPAIDYSYTLPIAMLNITNTYTVSVDQASGLVVKQVIASKVTKTVQTFKYDPSITFSLPDEAKNAKGK